MAYQRPTRAEVRALQAEVQSLQAETERHLIAATVSVARQIAETKKWKIQAEHWHTIYDDAVKEFDRSGPIHHEPWEWNQLRTSLSHWRDLARSLEDRLAICESALNSTMKRRVRRQRRNG